MLCRDYDRVKITTVKSEHFSDTSDTSEQFKVSKTSDSEKKEFCFCSEFIKTLAAKL